MLAHLPIADRDDLSMAYTPGVARVCMAIHDEPAKVHDLTIKGNTVAIVTDGTAVLGLGDIGPEASLPVMEGKALLFKEFAGVDAFPICLDVHTADEIVETVQRIAPVFGGINLEDIAAPVCFEVEERLRDLLDIPVFHDDQHGTAVVTLAALENAARVVGKQMHDLRVVISGVGAAGVAIAKILMGAGVPHIVGLRPQGRRAHRPRRPQRLEALVRREHQPRRLQRRRSARSLAGADVFIGVSAPDVITPDDVATMAKDPIVFAMANPNPEIRPELIKDLAAVIATGRSDFPNQINNVLAFPGHLPGRARRPGHRDHRGDEAGGGRGHRHGGLLRRPRPRLHHPVGVRPARGGARRPGGGRGRPRQRRQPGLTPGDRTWRRTTSSPRASATGSTRRWPTAWWPWTTPAACRATSACSSPRSGPGWCTSPLDVTAELLNPFGAAHGAVVASLVDHVLGSAVFPLVPPRHLAGDASSSRSTTSPRPVRASCVARAEVVVAHLAHRRGADRVHQRRPVGGHGPRHRRHRPAQGARPRPDAPSDLGHDGRVPIPLDEFPVHQAPLSMAYPVSSDRNVYDRCYLNAHDRTGDVFAIAGLGVYPNLGRHRRLPRRAVRRPPGGAAGLRRPRATTA